MNLLKKIVNNLAQLLILYLNIGIIHAHTPSMTELQEVSLHGSKQWIYITGQQESNPVLLVLHGGPGFAMLPLFHEKLPELETTFTVVNWDQRGAGKSYSNTIPTDSMTLNQLVEDAHELTQILKKKFHKNRIFLLGHSSGSIIGVRLIRQYPEDYSSYIGVGQVVNFAENENDSYDFALKSAIQNNNRKAEKQLKATGRPDKQGDYRTEEGYEITSHWVEYFGGSLSNHSNLDTLYDLIFSHSVYKGAEKKILKGYEFSQSIFEDNQMREFDLVKELQGVAIPVYILAGRNDFDTPVTLIKKYFDQLNIPSKKYIEFSNSAHFPFYEEPKQFVSTMNSILQEATKQNLIS
ncbi:MAG: alpha/beta hydrolase [Tatlockia sp.]|nr:alpha/beta hydrolase [Tatlockia sp.]